MKRTLLAIALLTIVLASCATPTTPATTPTPTQPPKYEGMSGKTPCEAGLTLDWDEEIGPYGCVLRDMGEYKVMYYGMDHGGRRAGIAVRSETGQFAWIEFIGIGGDDHQTISATGLKGNISVTTVINTSFIETITDITITSDYIQYDVACQDYLIAIEPSDGFDFLAPLIKTADGHIALETKDGLLTFIGWTQERHKKLVSVQYPANYGNVVQTAFQVGTQWADITATNCGGGVLGVEYMPR